MANDAATRGEKVLAAWTWGEGWQVSQLGAEWLLLLAASGREYHIRSFPKMGWQAWGSSFPVTGYFRGSLEELLPTIVEAVKIREAEEALQRVDDPTASPGRHVVRPMQPRNIRSLARRKYDAAIRAALKQVFKEDA